MYVHLRADVTWFSLCRSCSRRRNITLVLFLLGGVKERKEGWMRGRRKEGRERGEKE